MLKNKKILISLILCFSLLLLSTISFAESQERGWKHYMTATPIPPFYVIYNDSNTKSQPVYFNSTTGLQGVKAISGDTATISFKKILQWSPDETVHTWSTNVPNSFYETVSTSNGYYWFISSGLTSEGTLFAMR